MVLSTVFMMVTEKTDRLDLQSAVDGDAISRENDFKLNISFSFAT